MVWVGPLGWKLLSFSHVLAILGGVSGGGGKTPSDFLLCRHAPLNISECDQIGIFVTWFGTASERR